MTTKKKYYSDAGVSGNGTGALQQGILVGHDTKKILYEVPNKGYTNNESEFMSILILCSIVPLKSTIISDSQLAVNVCNRKWKTQMPNLKILAESISNILKLKKITLVWESRETNLAGNYIEQVYSL